MNLKHHCLNTASFAKLKVINSPSGLTLVTWYFHHLGEWSCPHGFHLFQESCYRIFYESLDHTDAELHCNSTTENGQLAKPWTILHVSNTLLQ